MVLGLTFESEGSGREFDDKGRARSVALGSGLHEPASKIRRHRERPSPEDVVTRPHRHCIPNVTLDAAVRLRPNPATIAAGNLSQQNTARAVAEIRSIETDHPGHSSR